MSKKKKKEEPESVDFGQKILIELLLREGENHMLDDHGEAIIGRRDLKPKWFIPSS